MQIPWFFLLQTRHCNLAACWTRALLCSLRLDCERAQGRPGAGGTRGPLREMHTQEEPHSSIQVVPITRPSLRDGRTAYAVLSREPNFPSGLPRRSNWMMPSARLGSRTSSIRLDRSNDGQDHTVLPYANSAARLHAGVGLTGTTRPARPISCRRCRVHRKPGSRSRRRRDRPSW